jgi:ribose transport system ATP-binding protein
MSEAITHERNSILQSHGICKRFGGVVALDNISFNLREGEVHALVGENGAGKSTYIKILTGLYKKDAGEIQYCDKPYVCEDPLEARQMGIGLVPQIVELAEQLTVAENIFMGVYPLKKFNFVDWDLLYKRAYEIAKTFNIENIIKTKVAGLGTGHRQLIEILKTLIYDTKIIAFDEPTASLSEDETKKLFELIKKLKADGISIIYVSHRLEELFKIADRVTVLKDGKYIGTHNVEEVSKQEIITMMVGREINLFGEDSRKRGKRGETLLQVKDLDTDNNVNGVDFTVNKGEILGFYGMVGSGRTETVMAVFGNDKCNSGEFWLRGQKIQIKTPQHAVRQGIGLVPENRISQGVILNASIKNNITLPFVYKLSQKRFGFINRKSERIVSKKQMTSLKIKAPDEYAKVETLSGGNQQKVSIAKWLASQCDVIFFDEPTHGIDVGAKADIYDLLRALSDEGKGVVMISSELPEILHVCDRILVFRDGKIVHEIEENKNITEEDVVTWALG